MKTTALQGNAGQLFYKDVGVVAGDITPAADLQQSKKKIRSLHFRFHAATVLLCLATFSDKESQGSILLYHRTHPIQPRTSSADLNNYGEFF